MWASPKTITRLVSVARGVVAAAAAAAVGCGCSGGGTAPTSTDSGDDATISFVGMADPLDPSDASLATRVSEVFNGTCAGITGETQCHGSAAEHLTLRLGPGGDVVGVPSLERPDLLRVEPGVPDRSYLYLKVLGAPGIDGGRMPLNQAAFDPRLPALIAAWIDAGAPSP